MSRNKNKCRCMVPGCKAWARRGAELCASHLRSRVVRGHAEMIVPLLRLMGEANSADAVTSPEVLDRELRELAAARRMFLEWTQALLRGQEGSDALPKGLTPAQFLRAWNDSTARVIQLLRARHELGAAQGEVGELLDEVYRRMGA